MTVIILIVILLNIAEHIAQNENDRSSTSVSEEKNETIMIEKSDLNADDTKWIDEGDKTEVCHKCGESEEYSLNKALQYFKQANVLYHHHYKSAEDKTKRFKKFEENLRMIIEMDEITTNATFKINEFTGLSLEEFTDKHTGFNDSLDDIDDSDVVHFSGTEAPVEINWGTIGFDVVRHQGGCKNSYLFSALGNIEIQYARKYKEIAPNLSPEQAFNCEPSGNCITGGLPHRVMKALKSTAGVMLNLNHDRSIHRDHLKTKSECEVDETKVVVRVTSVIRLNIDTEADLASALAVYGPLSIAIYVSESIKNYHSGVLNPVDCDGKANHAVLLTGYGWTNDSTPYWIIKNSWGVKWGESGYLRLIRGEGACDILRYAAAVTVEQYRQKSTATERTESNKTTPTKAETNETVPLTVHSEKEDNPAEFRIGSTIFNTIADRTDSIETENYQKNRKDTENIQVMPKETSASKEEIVLSQNRKAVTEEQSENKKRNLGLGTTEKENQSIEKPRIIIMDSSADSTSGEYGMSVLGNIMN